MNKCVVTGGCGFIGYHTCRRFLDEGWNVIAVDNLSRLGTGQNLKKLRSHKRFAFRKIDVCNKAALSRLMQRERPNIVIHLAAQVAVTTSVANPRLDFETNALGTFNVLESVRHLGVKPLVIYSSTNKVYGHLDDIRLTTSAQSVVWPKGWTGVDEKQPLDFYSPYGCSKGAADQYMRDYWRIYGIPTVVLRQSCIYGPGQMGIEDQGWVAWFAIAAMKKTPITIYGDGKQVRDLLNVKDLVNLYWLCAGNIKKVQGEVFNAGGGMDNTMSLREYLKFLTQQGLPTKLGYASPRQGDQKLFISNNKKLARILKWRPTISCQEGLRDMINDLAKTHCKQTG
jgi:CDP-paratose 2-epimerase